MLRRLRHGLRFMIRYARCHATLMLDAAMLPRAGLRALTMLIPLLCRLFSHLRHAMRYYAPLLSPPYAAMLRLRYAAAAATLISRCCHYRRCAMLFL